MTARLLLEVALRILGIWFIVTAVHTLTTTASLIMSGVMSVSSVDTTGWFLASGVSVAVQSGLGLGLVFCAPRVAAWFYPAQTDEGDASSGVGPGDVYHIACFVLGAYLFVSAAEPAGRIVNAGLRGVPFTMAGDAFTTIVYMAAGILLVVGSRRIGELISSLRYDPDSIPKQQISVKILLILVACLAVFLAVIRWLTVGGI